MKRPELHTVLKSYDVVGGRHTNGLQLTTKRFADANPKISPPCCAPTNEANAFNKAYPRDAAQIFATLPTTSATRSTNSPA